MADHIAPPRDLVAGEAAWTIRYRDEDECARLTAALPPGPVRTVLLGHLARVDGRLDECLELCRDAEAALPDPTIWRARVLECQGVALNDLRMGAEAQRRLSEAWSVYRALDHAEGIASVQQNIARLYFQPLETAMELYGDALRDARAAQVPELIGVVLLNYQLGLAQVGDDASERMPYAVEAYEILQDAWPRMAAYALCVQLDVAVQMGDDELAAALEARLPDPVTVADRMVRSHVSNALAARYLATGRAQRAVDLYERVLATELDLEQIVSHYAGLARALRASGKVDEAYAMAMRAYESDRALREDETSRAARALDAWNRASVLREDRVAEQARADALEVALRQLQEANRRIRELSTRDAVTGLHNRQHLLDQTVKLLESTTPEAPVEVALLDLDHFKRINDTRGHAAGDAALAEFAQALGASAAGTDLVARYGGEEFVVVRPHAGPLVDPDHSLCASLDRLRATLAGSSGITMSAGVTIVGNGDLKEALARADGLMYEAKGQGRDRVLCDIATCPTTGCSRLRVAG